VLKADNPPPSCADVKKSGGLNLLEPCGPVQACNGTAAAFYSELQCFKHILIVHRAVNVVFVLAL
jgi:hypothetical protein